jgi:hypothetical protein
MPSSSIDCRRDLNLGLLVPESGEDPAARFGLQKLVERGELAAESGKVAEARIGVETGVESALRRMDINFAAEDGDVVIHSSLVWFSQNFWLCDLDDDVPGE